jgi:hypothetical protein
MSETTVRYVCSECFNSYGMLSDLWTHRTQAHGWQQIGPRNWFRQYYDARPALEQRITALEAQVRELQSEIAILNTDPETVIFALSSRND